MIEVNLDRYILDLYETVMELGPLWSQFLLLFKVCTHTHTHTDTKTQARFSENFLQQCAQHYFIFKIY